MRRALENRDARRLVAGSRVDVVTAGSERPNAALRQIDLDGVIVAGVAQTERDSPPLKDDLGDPVAQARQFKLGGVGHVDGIRTDLDLAAGLRVRAQRFAGEDWLVQLGFGPVAAACGAKFEISRNDARPADGPR
jgi:hypothetical protein